ncbi:unannotated protein [freshwater metagenome]|uniref:Unannotated protein n=1 Tax=freshwater metagenome TaxID=449393 RepID=A0A6J7F6I9_9ZZZZ
MAPTTKPSMVKDQKSEKMIEKSTELPLIDNQVAEESNDSPAT